MRYVIAVIVGLAILAFNSPVLADDHTWQRPTECEDKDRESAGNRLTPCKYIIPVLEKIEYEVRMVYPKCWELLIYHMPGMKPLPDDFPYSRLTTYVRILPNQTYLNNYRTQYELPLEKVYFAEDMMVFVGSSWGSGSIVQKNPYGELRTDYTYRRISLFGREGPWSTAALSPDTTNRVELANACLALVEQEKASLEHADELARQEAAEAARIKAERDAAAKEEEQARLSAESQARIAEQQLAAANERRLAIARAEEIKTQTLIDEIALQEVLTEILNDIVRIRLAGQEDRARITNEYLARARTASESFDLETSEIESRIQEYIDFNAALLVEIAEYQLSIQNRLEALRASIEEQQAEIDRLEAEAQGIVAPVEEEEENIEEDQNGNGAQ